MMFDPHFWYWLADDGRVFSSERQQIVTADDAAYKAWALSGLGASPWPKDAAGAQTTAALQAALTPYGLYCDLVTYANVKQWAVATGGRSVQINGATTTIATTSESQALLSGKVLRLQQTSPPATVSWQIGPTEMATLTAADFMMMATSIADFVQATFDALPGIFAKIEDGTITTMAQIDAVFAAI